MFSDEIFGFGFILLKLAGCWSGERSFWTNKYYMVYNFIIRFLFADLLNIILLIDMLVGLDDFMLMAREILHESLEGFVASVKVWFFLANISKIWKLIDFINNEPLLQPKTDVQKQKFKEDRKISFAMSYIFIAVDMFVSTTFMFFPLLVTPHKLNLNCRYPFNVYQSNWVFYGTSVHQNLAITIAGVANIAVDSFVFCMAAFISAEIRLLGDNLRNIYANTEGRLRLKGVVPNSKDNDPVVLDHMEETLNECILNHQTILQVFNLCQKLLQWVLICQFGASAVSLGISLYNVSNLLSFKNFDFFALMGYNAFFIFEMYCLCWSGNMMSHQSDQLYYAIFESDWIHASKSFKKKMIFFMTNIKEPLEFSGLGLFPLNFGVFLAILKTAMSYYTLLKTVDGKS